MIGSDLLNILTPSFFLTAILYSMVGFGGGSTYLALMALLGFPLSLMPTTALICNLVVVTGGCYFYFKEKTVSLKLVMPFLITSIPFAYFGGRLPVSRSTFILLLGISLFCVGLRLFFVHKDQQNKSPLSWKKSFYLGLPIGAVLGFLSGLTGIGGGIFLAPILYFLGWGSPKQIAAAASVFIFSNSLSGLSGQLIKNTFFIEWSLVLPLVVAVFLGGQIGSRVGTKKLKRIGLQRLTAALVFFVSTRLLWSLI